MNPDRAKGAREILAFYLEAGVDALVGDAPVDRFADALPQARSAAAAARVADAEPWPRDDQASLSKEASRPLAGTLRPTPADALARFRSRVRGGGTELADAASQKLAPVSPDAAAMAARAAAPTAASLEGLRAILERFDGCALKGTASQLVFHDGNPQA